MPMMMAIGSVAAPVVGGLVGNLMSQKDKSAQKKAMKRALAELEALGVPPDLSKELFVEELQRQGVYTPELEDEISVAESEYTQIKEDPELQKAQLEALTGLQQRAQVGLSAEDRAALNQVRQQTQRDAEAKRQQVMQQMQARGMGGSGAELIAQLQAGQGAAELASQQSDQLMAQAQQRALQALGQSGEMAGQMQQAQFGREAQKAQALDERNRFLAQNSIARQQRNVSSLNQAQAANLAEQQRIYEQNIVNRRAEAERQNVEQGNYWDRKTDLAKSKANALTGQAQYYGQQAASTAKGFADMGAGIGTAAAGIGSASPGTTTISKDGTVTKSGGSLFGNLFSGSAEDGGIVGDPETAGGATIGKDNVNMNLREGEMVLNAPQQKALFDFIDRISKKYPKD